MIPSMERDQTWVAMVTVAERMTATSCAGTSLAVAAVRRRNLLSVIEGLHVGDNWTDVYEPVRKRRYFSGAWTELQPVNVAASSIGAFLRERPDLSSE
jgi:hypothetical protein